MKTAIIYSSITGNTKKIADALGEALSDPVLFHIDDAPLSENFDLLILGYWVDRGSSDRKVTDYMKRLKDCSVILFGTMGADPESEYGKNVKKEVEKNLTGCRILFHAGCRGGMRKSTLDRYMKKLEENPGDELARRKVKSYHASFGHPDDNDIKSIVDGVKDVVLKFN